jgi:twitching motility protein PilT
MKPLAELLRYLSHPAITEIALTTGRCPMIKSLNGYEPVDSSVLTDEELTRTLLTMVGPARAASVSEKPMKWSVRAEGVATLAVIAVRRGEGLSMRVMRTGDAAASNPGKPSETTPAPGSGANAAAASRIPETTPRPGASAVAASEPAPAEPPAASPRDTLPPTVAPLIPPVRRPSVTGLRVIKASSAGGAQDSSPAAGALPSFPKTLSPLAPPPPPPQTVAPPVSEELPTAPYSFPPPFGADAKPAAPQAATPPVSAQTRPAPMAFPPPVSPHERPPPPVPTPLPIDLQGPPPSLEDSSIDISIQEPESEAAPEQLPEQASAPEPEEHTGLVQVRPQLPPRARPDFWRDLPSLMEEARRIGASDMHIVSGRPALFRVAGELKPDGEPLPPKRVEQMVLSQVPARLRAAFDRDGSCDFALQSEAHGRFRVNVCRQRSGLKGSFRLIPKELPSLESLGLPVELIRATRYSHGLVFITGPSGQGKTSTLAALVEILNRETRRHILTVEDPVEFVHPRKRGLISQREVGTHTRSVATALKAALREDADVIVVGELRDAETVRLALTASETGRLVLGTMNTPNSAKTLGRIIDLFPAAEQAQVRYTLGAHLRLIVSQRLVPSSAGGSLVAAAEVLPGSVALSHLIRDDALSQLPALFQRSRDQGAIRLEDALAELVRSRKTTLEIAKDFAESPEVLEALVTGTAPELPPEPSSGGRKLASVLDRKSA